MSYNTPASYFIFLSLLCKIDPRNSISFSISCPATLNGLSIPTTLEWALWAVPKASLMKISPSWDSSFLKAFISSGLLLIFFPSASFTDPSSSGWYLTFSQRKISPYDCWTAFCTSSPMQSSRKLTRLPSISSRGPTIGLREFLGTLWPFGLPWWERRTRDLGLC